MKPVTRRTYDSEAGLCGARFAEFQLAANRSVWSTPFAPSTDCWLVRPPLAHQQAAALAFGRRLRPPPLGLTLLEVVLGIGIFLGAMAVLSQLISTGVRAAVQARWQTQAALRCQSKMEEIVAGIEPLEDVSEGFFDDDEEGVWRWSLTVLPGPEDNLYELTVRVWRDTAEQSGLGQTSYSLTRYYFDRQAVAEALELEQSEPDTSVDSEGT